jgi:hypothetical protein
MRLSLGMIGIPAFLRDLRAGTRYRFVAGMTAFVGFALLKMVY